MMKKLLLFVAFLLAAKIGMGQTYTFSGQIANIIYGNCTSCHRAGSIAPFSLETYLDVKNNANAIAYAVQNKIMPPWSPNPSYNQFCGERKLSQDQVNAISEWVKQGAPEGNKAEEPTPPPFNDGSKLVNADFSKRIKVHTVKKTLDEFAFFSIPANISQDKFIESMELVPGNRKIVHHIFIFLDSTGQFSNFIRGDSVNLNNGGNYISGGNMNMIKLIGGWLPGGTYYTVPDKMAFHVRAGSSYIIQIHYAPGSYGKSDSTQLNIKYASEHIDMSRCMSMKPLLDNAVNLVKTGLGKDTNLHIPANTVKTFYEEAYVQQDMSVISITPHQHLLGKRLLVYAYNPSNHDTIRLIDDRWNFHWQGMYTFPKVVHIPLGYKLRAEGTYDNTTNNTDNPNYPPKDIYAGTSTLTEMMQVFFCWVPYRQGDENITLGTVDEGTGIFTPQSPEVTCNIYPNPASAGQQINILSLPSGNYNMELYGADGKLVYSFGAVKAIDKVSLQMPQVSKGLYFMKISNSKTSINQKLMVE